MFCAYINLNEQKKFRSIHYKQIFRKQQKNIFIKCMQKCYKLTFKQQTFLILKYIIEHFLSKKM